MGQVRNFWIKARIDGRHIEQDGHGFTVVTDRDKPEAPKRARSRGSR